MAAVAPSLSGPSGLAAQQREQANKQKPFAIFDTSVLFETRGSSYGYGAAKT
ncbi:hypothetical protein GMORB2_3560 [Geosmithia morbida]|uniref:Uncharacterized protein n=1 Tax=Geosmithia morbida TaxID=1094350 RepID=A0A9P4YQC4_9HYPO|nr:uncharacterized protein GMORB2_3560 [Geosmithia morbida]KAF4119872.1 hypothetical protein GMORB2_3560 [Geosmithia morbida]